MRFSDIAWNLAGLGAPLAVAALTVPSLIETLGHERFGLLALAWGLIGYAGALDLGLGRALTQMVARLRGENNLQDIPDILITASRITLLTGLVAGVLIALLAMLGGASWIHTESTNESEIRMAIYLLAIALPAQAMSATYKGLNEAFINFRGVSLLRAGLGIINFAGPFAISIYTTELAWLVSSLVVSRLLALIIYKKLAMNCLSREMAIKQSGKYSRTIAKKLFAFGGWVTVSSIISPILVQADRFFIAAMISASAVTIYVLPYEIVVQSLILVGSISSVMFPILSRMMHENSGNWRAYFKKWLWRVCLLMGIVCLTLALLLPEILHQWIGRDLSPQSIVIGQILCLGVFCNSIGSIYYAFIQANGRADLTAKIHFVELPVYIFSLIIFSKIYGLEGVAVAWVLRMLLDVFLLYFVKNKIVD